jgi:D-cysteine desulfhydrase
VRLRALDERIGVELHVKRDDVTGGAEAGNKLRKLEFLLARAVAERADVVLTCGGIQSNHARATALAAARLGMRSVLFLRMQDPKEPLPLTGNVMLDRMVGAEIRRISYDEWRERDALMANAAAALAARGARPFVIPEGGSNGLGSMGYVEAMREVREQIELGLAGDKKPFDFVVHACGSGGTAAGVALGAARFGVAPKTIAMAVCDDVAYFTKRIRGIVEEAKALAPDLGEAPFTVDDSAKGPAYAVASEEQKSFIAEIARATGLIFDPVYTGKALFGLALAVRRGSIPLGSRVLFLHTGGLPGLLADGESFRAMI